MYFAGDDTKVPADISGRCFFIDQENQSQEEVACPVDNVPNKGMAHVFTVGEGEEYNCSVFDIDTMTEIQGCQPATRAQLFKPEAPVIAAPSPSPKADPKAEDPKPAGPIVEGAIKCVYDLVGSLIKDKSQDTCPVSIVPGECTEEVKGCEPDDAKHSAQIKGEMDTMAEEGYVPVLVQQIRNDLYYNESTNEYYYDPFGMAQPSGVASEYFYFLKDEYQLINIGEGIKIYAPPACEGYVGLKEQFTDAVWDEWEEDAGIIIHDEFFKLDEGCQKENVGTDEAPVWLYFADPSFGELVRIKDVNEPWPQIINSEGNIYSVNGQLYRIKDNEQPFVYHNGEPYIRMDLLKDSPSVLRYNDLGEVTVVDVNGKHGVVFVPMGLPDHPTLITDEEAIYIDEETGNVYINDGVDAAMLRPKSDSDVVEVVNKEEGLYKVNGTYVRTEKVDGQHLEIEYEGNLVTEVDTYVVLYGFDPEKHQVDIGEKKGWFNGKSLYTEDNTVVIEENGNKVLLGNVEATSVGGEKVSEIFDAGRVGSSDIYWIQEKAGSPKRYFKIPSKQSGEAPTFETGGKKYVRTDLQKKSIELFKVETRPGEGGTEVKVALGSDGEYYKVGSAPIIENDFVQDLSKVSGSEQYIPYDLKLTYEYLEKYREDAIARANDFIHEGSACDTYPDKLQDSVREANIAFTKMKASKPNSKDYKLYKAQYFAFKLDVMQRYIRIKVEELGLKLQKAYNSTDDKRQSHIKERVESQTSRTDHDKIKQDDPEAYAEAIMYVYLRSPDSGNNWPLDEATFVTMCKAQVKAVYGDRKDDAEVDAKIKKYYADHNGTLQQGGWNSVMIISELKKTPEFIEMAVEYETASAVREDMIRVAYGYIDEMDGVKPKKFPDKGPLAVPAELKNHADLTDVEAEEKIGLLLDSAVDQLINNPKLCERTKLFETAKNAKHWQDNYDKASYETWRGELKIQLLELWTRTLGGEIEGSRSAFSKSDCEKEFESKLQKSEICFTALEKSYENCIAEALDLGAETFRNDAAESLFRPSSNKTRDTFGDSRRSVQIMNFLMREIIAENNALIIAADRADAVKEKKDKETTGTSGLPEGIDPKVLEQINEYAQKNNLTPEAAAREMIDKGILQTKTK